MSGVSVSECVYVHGIGIHVTCGNELPQQETNIGD